MRFHLISLFPEIFNSFLDTSLIAKAREDSKIYVTCHNVRDYALPPHRKVADEPYGGGPGMVMKPEPLVTCIEKVRKVDPCTRVICLTPAGIPYNQALAKKLSAQDSLTLLCGRYEGIDERVMILAVDEQISIGDYVLM